MIEVSADELRKAVEATHGCPASFKEAVRVTETFNGQMVWDGIVHMFTVDHPKTTVCYSWSSPVDGSNRRRFYAVLGVPPVNSAKDAVRAAIVAEHGARG